VKITVHPYFLEFIRPFALAHGTRLGTQLAFVKIEHEGVTAYGEASLPPYLRETFESVKKWVHNQSHNLTNILGNNPFENPENLPLSPENPAASAAFQAAIINWFLSNTEEKLADHFLSTDYQPDVTLTITKSDLNFLNEKLKLEKDFTHFKLKLTGHRDDLDFVKYVRSKTSLPFCVDVNQGHQQKEEAIRAITQLEKLNCDMIEQPLNKKDHDGHYWLKERTKLPIVADESISNLEDLIQFHEAYSGVNIKLMKCGGLFQAQKMIDYNATIKNRQSGEKFLSLIGCMSESTLGVSMAASLAHQCNMADLDSPYLNANDPFEGFKIIDKKIVVEKCIKLKNQVNLH
jgi:L-alanine-DL-glutamate epimerase-like enolase superfamily enzyme